MKLFLATTADEYELPIAVGRSTLELGKMLGIKPITVYNHIKNTEAGNGKTRIKVFVIKTDED